jgi:dTDP-4-dehydrorhamnose 3,5-epimerase
MQVVDLPIPGLKLFKPQVFRDGRGYFLESYRRERLRELGIDVEFVQDNHSHSVQHSLRGLHFQSTPGQAKLLRVASGRIWDVAVDIRLDSPTFGRWYGTYLDGEAHEQMFLPVGFAHGFCVISDFADVLYKVSTPYVAATERAIAWDDPELGIEWPVKDPVLSPRDQTAGSFADFKRALERSGS